MKHRITTCTFILIINLIVSLFSLSMVMPQEIKTIEVNTPRKEVLRLHILAESDSSYDQAIKYKVRNQVTNKVAKKIDNTQDLKKAKKLIKASQPELTFYIDKFLQQEGANYESQVSLKKKEFPTRLYGNQLYTAGEYEALQISLGQGQGENWWCVIFPVLCHVEEIDASSNKEIKIVKKETNSQIQKGNNTKSSEEHENDKQELEVRFYLLELIKEFF